MNKIQWENYQDGDSTPLSAENLNLMQDNIEEEFGKLLNFFYPIGTIYETTSNNLNTVAKMNAHFGGTWEKYGAGRVTVAQNSATFNTLNGTGGEETHTLTVAETPNHTHKIFSSWAEKGSTGPDNFKYGANINAIQDPPSYRSGGFGPSNFIELVGGGGSHNNIQPYIVVYRYRRTA